MTSKDYFYYYLYLPIRTVTCADASSACREHAVAYETIYQRHQCDILGLLIIPKEPITVWIVVSDSYACTMYNGTDNSWLGNEVWNQTTPSVRSVRHNNKIIFNCHTDEAAETSATYRLEAKQVLFRSSKILDM